MVREGSAVCIVVMVSVCSVLVINVEAANRRFEELLRGVDGGGGRHALTARGGAAGRGAAGGRAARE